MPSRQRKALFIQATEPGAYPPLINAAHVLADDGWAVTFLAAPIAGKQMSVTPAPGIDIVGVAERPSHVMSKKAYLAYCYKAIVLARQLKPNVVYASDPIGALPGWLAAKLSGAQLVYHEHDSPSAERDLRPVVRWPRRWAAKAAAIVIFPNVERGRVARDDIGFIASNLQIVWNVPRLAELPTIPQKSGSQLILWYHGSINPERLPETVLESVSKFDGAVRLDVAGYESPGSQGYIELLKDRWNINGLTLINYIGEIQYHPDLLKYAARCDVGLAFMPMETVDINMKYMTGASNKAFDYMAAGLAVMVSSLPDWKAMYSDCGFGLACDPRSASEIELQLAYFITNKNHLERISNANRNMIFENWNYENVFRGVLRKLNTLPTDRRNRRRLT